MAQTFIHKIKKENGDTMNFEKRKYFNIFVKTVLVCSILSTQSAQASGDIEKFFSNPKQSVEDLGRDFGKLWNNTVDGLSDFLTLGAAGRRRDQERAEQQAKFYAAQAQMIQQQLQLQTEFVKGQVKLVFDYYCGDLKSLSRVHELKVNTAKTLLLMKGALYQTISAANNIEAYRSINDSLKNQLIPIEAEIKDLASGGVDKSILDFNKVILRLTNLAKSSSLSTELLLSYTMSKLYQNTDSAVTSLKMMAMLQANILVLLNDFENQIENSIQKTFNINASNLAQLMILSPNTTPALIDGADDIGNGVAPNEIKCSFVFDPNIDNNETNDENEKIYRILGSFDQVVSSAKNSKLVFELKPDGKPVERYTGLDAVIKGHQFDRVFDEEELKEKLSYVKKIEGIIYSVASSTLDSEFDKIKLGQYVNFEISKSPRSDSKKLQSRYYRGNMTAETSLVDFIKAGKMSLDRMIIFAEANNLNTNAFVGYLLRRVYSNAGEANDFMLGQYRHAVNYRSELMIKSLLSNMGYNVLLSIEPAVRKKLAN